MKNKKTSVAADHHSAGAETPIVFCVEVPQDPLVPGDSDDVEGGDDYDDDSDDAGVPEDLLESQHSDNKVMMMMKKVYPEAPL